MRRGQGVLYVFVYLLSCEELEPHLHMVGFSLLRSVSWHASITKGLNCVCCFSGHPCQARVPHWDTPILVTWLHGDVEYLLIVSLQPAAKPA